MKYFAIGQDRIYKKDRPAENTGVSLCLMDFNELRADNGPELPAVLAEECLRDGMQKFESHEGYDFISLHIPDIMIRGGNTQRICIYFSKSLLAFIGNGGVQDKLAEQLASEGLKNLNAGRILYLFFDRLTSGDTDALEELEQSISAMEEDLIADRQKDLRQDIIAMRRKLMVYKRYYEQLLDILEDLEENENELFDKKTLRYFKMVTGRADRLYHSILNLRDYVTQVREAYQAQIDIGLNRVMKIFTVIAAIFLPLTLIAGWYGMNLQMPEYGWRHGYLFVIGLSAAVVTVSVLFIRKNKWF